MFLLEKDYKKQIREEVRGILGGKDPEVLQDAERGAITRMIGYLHSRYDTGKIFAPLVPWDPTTAFLLGSRLVVTAEAYKTGEAYDENELCSHLGNVFLSLAPGTITAPTVEEGEASWVLVASLNSLYYPHTEAPAGTLPTDTAFFRAGDLRNAVIKDTVIDIAVYDLHSNITLRQIPTLRIDRYKAAMDWLKDLRDGLLEDPTLPVRLTEDGGTQGSFVRFGSNKKKNHYY